MSSNNVDERVVKMTFDNAQFESGVKQTLTSLEELKQSLNFNNSLTGIQAVSSAFNSFSLANVTTQLDALTSRFSTLGIVGMTAIENITNKVLNFTTSKIQSTIGQISTGGWARASSIAQARFTLQGLLNDEGKVKEAFDSASSAVDGTAYSLNAAVSVASQLAASGIDVGEEMENTLKGIAGTAAMTGDSFESIGNIFTTVAGNGRLMGMQLSQLSYHGLNAAATIAEYLGTTEDAVREMTSKGEISFDTFSKAMQSAFGEHAKDANKTFSGSMDNIKSALSRIGAIFSSGIIENDDLINALNTIRITINSIKTAMLPLETKFKNLVSAVSNAFSGVLGEFNVKPFETFIDIVGRAMDTVSGLINRWSRAKGYLKESLFGEDADKKIEATAEQLERANEAIQKANDIWEKAAYGVGEKRKELLGEDYDLVQALVNQRAAGITDLEDTAVDMIIKSDEAMKAQNQTIAQTNQELEETPKKVAPIAKVILAFKTFISGIRTIANNIKTTLTVIGNSFKKVFNWQDLIADIQDYGNMFSEFVGHFTLTEERSEKLETALTGLWSAFDLLRMIIKAVAGGLSKTLGPVLSVIFDVLLTIASTVGSVITKFRDWYRENDLLKGVLETLGTVISKVIEYVTIFFQKLNQLPAVQKIKEELKEFAELVGEKLLGYLGDAQEALGDFFGEMDDAEDNPKMQKILDSINTGLENLIAFAGDAKENYGKFIDWITGKAEGLELMGEDAETASYRFDKFKKGLKSLVDGEGLSEFIDNMSGVFGDFAGQVDKFVSWIIEKFNSLDAANIALIGFGTTMVTTGLSFANLSWNLSGLIKAFTEVPTQLAKTISSVKGIFKSISEYIKNDSQAKLIKAYAIAIAVLAASLVALTFVDQDKLENATNSMALLMAIMLATVGVVALVASKSKNFVAVNAVMRSASLLFIAVAAAAFILAQALVVLNQLDFKSDDWWKPLVTLAGIFVALGVLSVVVSKFAANSSFASLGLISIAASVWLIAKALSELNNVNTIGLQEKIKALGEVLLEVAAFFVIIRKLATGEGTVNVLAVLGMIASIWLIEIALMDIITYGVTLDEIKQNIDKFVPVIIALVAVVAAVSAVAFAAKNSTSMAGTIIAFAVSVILITLALKKLSDMAQTGDLASGLVALTAIFIDLVVLMFVLDKVAAVAKGIGKELVHITIAVGVLAAIAYALSYYADHLEEFRLGVAMVFLAITLVGYLSLMTRLARNVDYKSLYAMVVAVGVVTLAIGIMSYVKDKLSLLQAAGILGLALIGLGTSLYLASEWAGQINTKSIIAMVLMISMVTTSLYLLLDKSGGDYKSMAAAGLSMAAVFIALGVALLAIGKIFQTKNGVSVTAQRLQLLAEMIVMIGVISVALSLLTATIKYAGTDALGSAVLAMLFMLATMVVAMNVLAKSSLKFDKSMTGTLILMIISLVAIAGSLALLTAVTGENTSALMAAMVAISLVMVSVGVTLGIISKLADDMSVTSVVAFGLAIGVLAAVAGSLWLVLGTGVDWKTMLAAAGSMVAVLIAVSFAIGLLAAIGKSGVGIGIIIGVAAALSVTMIALGFSMKLAAQAIKTIVAALKELTNVDFTVLEENFTTLLKYSGLFAILAVTSLVFGTGLIVVGAGLVSCGIGATALGIGLSLIVAEIVIVTKAVANFMLALNGLITTFKTSKGDISSGITEIGTGLAGALTGFITTLAADAPKIKDSLTTIVRTGVEVIADGINAINDAILDGITTFLTSVEEKLPTINEKLNAIIIEILSSIAKNAATYGYYGAVISVAFLYGLSMGIVEYAPQIGETIANVITALFTMAQSLIESLMPGLTDLVYDGVLNMSEALWGLIAMSGNETAEEMYNTVLEEKAYRANQKTAKAFGTGYTDEMQNQQQNMTDATNKAVDSATDTSDIAAANSSDSAGAAVGGFTETIANSKDKLKEGLGNLMGDTSITEMISGSGGNYASLFMGSMNTQMQQETMDVSHLPASVVEDMKKQGWELEEGGKTMTKMVETGVNEQSDSLNFDKLNENITNNLGDEDALFDNGDSDLGYYVEGLTNLDDEQLAKVFSTGEKLGNALHEGTVSKGGLDENSPSKKGVAAGEYYMEGLIAGGQNLASRLYDTYTGIAGNAASATAATMSSISKVMQDESIDWQPTLTPVIDDSQLQNGSNLLTATFGNSALNLAADTALSVKDNEASNLATQVAELSAQVKKLADTDYSKMLDGVSINVDASTNVDGTPLRKMASNYTIKQIDAQQSNYNMSRGARA